MKLVPNEIFLRRFVHPTQNPILRFGPAFSPECSAFAFFAFAISRSSISCFTFHLLRLRVNIRVPSLDRIRHSQHHELRVDVGGWS